MADSPFPRVVALSGGLVCAALFAAYLGLGGALAHSETSALNGLPESTRQQAGQLYRAVRLQPWSSSEYTRLGMFYLANKRLEPAIEWLHRATVWSSGDYEPWYYLGLAERSAHRAAEAEGSFRKVLQLNPDYIAARFQMAGLKLDQGLLAEAVDAFGELATARRADKARAAQGLGAALLRKGEYSLAVRAFSQAIADFSNYGDAHSGLAAALKALGDEAHAAHEARLAYDWRAVEPLRIDDPLTERMEQDFPSGLSLFQTAARTRDPRENLATMEKALALDPSMTFGWEYIIGLYGVAHRPRDAEDAWERLRRIDPNSTRGRYEFALALSRNVADHAKAAALLNEAVIADPSFSEAHRALGVLAHMDGNRDEAARQYRLALAGDPSMTEAHIDLGVLLLKEGDTKEGNAELLRALVPPCENPERVLARELALLGNDAAEPGWEAAVRGQATARNQLSLITLLNNRKKAPRVQTAGPTAPPVSDRKSPRF